MDLAARRVDVGDGRPSDEGAHARATRVVERHGAAVMRTARRYSRTPDDAEDAYQRGVEILLTKSPDIPEPELVPWLKTVVKHEAFAIRRQGSRVALGVEQSFDGDAEGDGERRLAAVPGPDEQAERLDQLRTGAEAMGQLKPQEIRCLTLLAEGYSYRQIQDITGFSYTKVNRCLTEGRQSFRRRLEGIESGAECRRLAPALSALADGEAAAEDLVAVRRHLQGCLACRAALRDFRAAPARVAALVPPAVVAAGGAGICGPAGGLPALGGSLWRKATAAWMKLRAVGEAATLAKAGAVAAAAAVAASAGVAVRVLDGSGEGERAADRPAVVERGAGAARAPAGAWRAERRRARRVAARRRDGGRPKSRSAGPERPEPETGQEARLAPPGGGGASAAVPAPVATPAPTVPRASAPEPAPRRPSGDGGGEFGP